MIATSQQHSVPIMVAMGARVWGWRGAGIERSRPRDGVIKRLAVCALPPLVVVVVVPLDASRPAAIE